MSRGLKGLKGPRATRVLRECRVMSRVNGGNVKCVSSCILHCTLCDEISLSTDRRCESTLTSAAATRASSTTAAAAPAAATAAATGHRQPSVASHEGEHDQEVACVKYPLQVQGPRSQEHVRGKEHRIQSSFRRIKDVGSISYFSWASRKPLWARAHPSFLHRV